MSNILGFVVGCLVCLQSCGQKRSVNDAVKPPQMLEEVYETARKANNIRSFLVSRENKLIAEEYFVSYGSDSLDHVRSVTKSVMSILIGIAIDQGIIKNVEESISTYLDVPEGKEVISIKHLLTMTSGISWNEGANAEGYGAWSGSPNELKYILDKPMAVEPGTVWNYNSGAIHILSAILTNASGMSTLKFANKYLFEPIGIDDIKWEKQSDGYYNGAAGLELKPRDMIRFGQLLANNGSFNGKQIISEQFMREATSHHQPDNMVLDEGSGYGYCWYLIELDSVKMFAALGYAGQTIVIAPELSFVTTLTYNWRGVNGARAAKQQKESTNVLVRQVVEWIRKK